jgi:hypothetical protein
MKRREARWGVGEVKRRVGIVREALAGATKRAASEP